MRVSNIILPVLGAFALVGPPAAIAAGGGASASGSSQPSSSANTTSSGSGSGGAAVAQAAPASTPYHPMVAGAVGKIIHGLAYAPADAPIQVQKAIWAGDKIRHKPYIYAGGHGTWNDAGYDCSGTVSYVLHAAGLLSSSMDSSGFMSWGYHGLGRWMTIYTNPGHAFIEIAGIRLDTSSEGDPNGHSGSGPRWRPLLQDTSGYVRRHPSGL